MIKTKMSDYSRKAAILKCSSCLGEIQSKYRYDFVYCDCGAIFTDGGNDCARYGCEPGYDLIVLKEFGESK
jgi:hypothetical protein